MRKLAWSVQILVWCKPTENPVHSYSMYLLSGIEFQEVFRHVYSCHHLPAAADLQSPDSVWRGLNRHCSACVLICSVSVFNFDLWWGAIGHIITFLWLYSWSIQCRWLFFLNELFRRLDEAEPPFQESLLLPQVTIMLPYQVHFRFTVSIEMTINTVGKLEPVP